MPKLQFHLTWPEAGEGVFTFRNLPHAAIVEWKLAMKKVKTSVLEPSTDSCLTVLLVIYFDNPDR